MHTIYLKNGEEVKCSMFTIGNGVLYTETHVHELSEIVSFMLDTGADVNILVKLKSEPKITRSETQSFLGLK